MPPETLSHYRLLEPLGAGGMGEVFKAQDTKLEREVALKLLPAESVRDPERLQRFKKEALATSSLNHPNITTIFEIDEADGQHFISLEYVKGRTLRVAMSSGTLEIRELLGIAVQVAEGLHAAHQAGVVHRDLKPDNIMVREDGIAKILDFGLAKLSAAEPPGDQDETVLQAAAPGSDSLTRPGVVMGTASYMSPEQARGQQLDHRSDVFSFGSILYEMVSGTPPFTAESSVEVMHALIRDQPRPLQEWDSGVPSELVRIIRKAMAKSPDERYQTAKDMAIDLRALEREIDSGALSVPHAAVSGPSAAVPPRSAWLLVGVVSVVVLLTVAAVLFFRSGGGGTVPTPSASLRVSKITSTGDATSPAFSPDGRFVAFDTKVDGQEAIHVRQMATGSEVEIVPPRQDVLVGNIAFAPDGNWVLYTTRSVNERRRTLWRVSSVGGTPREVLRDVDSAPSFSPDGQSFIFGRFVESDAYFFTASFTEVGEPQQVYSAPEDAVMILSPSWSPTGDVAYTQFNKDDVLYPKIMVKPPDGGTPRMAPGPRWMQITGLAWSTDGNELYVCGSRSWIERPQIWRLNLSSGEARRITSDLDIYSGVVVRGDGQAVAAQRTTYDSHLWRISATGSPQENSAGVQRITRGTADSGNPDVHPDGSRVLFDSDADGDLNAWSIDLDGENRTQFTFGETQDFWPCWSPDGQMIAYGSEQDGDLQVWVMGADGQDARQLTHSGTTNYAPSFSPDGEWIAYISSMGDSSFVYKIPVAGGDPVRVSDTQGVWRAQWSPDGRWIATWGAGSPGSPLQQIVLLPAREGEEEHRIDVTVRTQFEMSNLTWHPHDGISIALRTDDVMNVYVLDVPGGAPRQVTDFTSTDFIFAHDWAPDGTFLIAQRGVIASDIVLLENLP